MSQPESQTTAGGSHALFNGPSFHVSGVQVVPDPGEVSLYFTSGRHLFSSSGSQVRTINEMTVRLILSPAGVERIADALRTFVEQQKRSTPPS